MPKLELNALEPVGETKAMACFCQNCLLAVIAKAEAAKPRQ
jgi:hypothetical protein